MKLKHLIGTFVLAGVLAIGATTLAANAFSSSEAKSVEAATYTGEYYVKMNATNNWGADSAKLGLYLFNGSNNGWASEVPVLEQKDSPSWYKFTYSLSFKPAKAIVVRLDASATKGSWDSKWGAQTSDITLGSDHQCIWSNNDWGDSVSAGSYHATATVWSLTQSVAWHEKAQLTNGGINYSHNYELSGYLTLEENEEFKIVDHDGNYYNNYSAEIPANFTRDNDQANIKCVVPGTYNFFFDMQNFTLWITSKDAVDADGWAQYFLANVNCDNSGKTLPSGWQNCKTEYLKLSDSAQKYVGDSSASESGNNLQKAMARYDLAISRHPSLDNFVITTGGGHRHSVHIPSVVPSIINDNSNAIMAVVIVSVVSLTSIGGYFYLRHKKEQ